MELIRSTLPQRGAAGRPSNPPGDASLDVVHVYAALMRVAAPILGVVVNSGYLQLRPVRCAATFVRMPGGNTEATGGDGRKI